MTSRSLLSRLAVVLPTLAATPWAAAAQRDTLRYELSLAQDASGARVVDVHVTLRGDADGRTTLRLPSEWGAQRALYRAVVDLGAAGAATRVDGGAGAESLAVRRVRHDSGASLELRYRLRQDWDGLLQRATYWRVLLGDDLALLTGHNALVLPVRDDSVRCVVAVRWRDLPADWQAESSFGGGAEWEASTTYGALRDVLLAAGRLRVQERTVDGQRVRVAMHGAWDFADSTFGGAVERLLVAERRFWRDGGSAAPYLVVLAPSASAAGGAALADAMLAVAHPATPLVELAPVVAHEIFHQWSGRRLRARPDGRHRWLVEGVTDFYADRFARDAGLLPPDGYLRRVNDVLVSYYTSPVREVPEPLVERRYWRDPWLMQLPYRRGYVLSLRLDALLRMATKDAYTLDDWLRAVYDAALAAGGELTDAMLADAVPDSLRARVHALLVPVLQAGETVPLSGHELGRCHGYRVARAIVARPEFDPVQSAWDQRVRGVREGSAAHAAGLRDGMPIIGWEWRQTPTAQAVEVLLDGEAGAERRIRYEPRERATVGLPQFEARRGCRER